jgi:two-component sensor histidine kinase
MEDVTEHEEADAQLHEALQEKEALLKEIHHRVKNNLQIISSLLRLQARSTADPDSISILQESRNRVETIALIHENLYQSASFSRINFAVYAGRLLANVIGIHQVTPDGVKVTVDIEPLMFDPQTAVLCGLILNELVANALRHAFPGHQKGEIKIQAHARDEKAVIMSVGDNGVGMPQEFDLGQVHSLGIQLVRQLTRQLKGTMSVSSRNGAVVRIEFPFHESLWSAEQEAM